VFVGTSVTAGLAVFEIEIQPATVVNTDAVSLADEDDSRDERLRMRLAGCCCTTDVFVGKSADDGPCGPRARGCSPANSHVPFRR
jgi:hypothetical protein